MIVEDERLALQHLCDLVAADARLELLGTPTTGEEAVAAITRLKPDLIFLDIQLPEFDGLEVLRRVPHEPVVVFTTAFDQYAVRAFELGAVDYLLKPFGDDRFALAVERAIRELRTPAEMSSGARARTTLGVERPLTRLFVRDRDRITPVLARDITRAAADGDYVGLHVQGRRHLVEVTLTELEAALDPHVFRRVHRSHLINLDHVRAIMPYDAHRLMIELTDGSRVVASRSGSRALKEAVI